MARLGWAGGLTPPPLSDDTMPERRSLAPRGLVPQGAKPGEGVPARFEHHEVRLDGVHGAPGPGRPADAGDAVLDQTETKNCDSGSRGKLHSG